MSVRHDSAAQDEVADADVPALTVDVVVVGTGVGGLTAALLAQARGLEVLVLEKSEFIGGTSAWSGGVLWIPDNHLMRAAGVPDSVEAGMAYLESVVGDTGPAATRARQEMYVRRGPEVVRFLEDMGVDWVYADGATDYYPERPGGLVRGRSLNARVFDTRKLADRESWLRPQKADAVFPVVLAHYAEAPPMATMLRSPRGARTALRVAARTAWGWARRKRLASLGMGLMARMLWTATRHGVPIWRSTPAIDLLVEDQRVVGVLVERGGGPVRVCARRGVVLTAGGYAHNGPIRKEYRDPADADWSLAVPEDTGDMLTAAQRQCDAAVDLMDEAIWTPVSMTPDGRPVAHLWERWLPHAIIVDGTGSRYVNESTSYMAVGQAMYERDAVAPAIPSWLVIDARHRRRYPFGNALPGITPRSWITSGYLKKAGTVEELAELCDLPPTALRATVDRFNRMAAAGVDEDFGRGNSQFDLYFHDPTVRPCPVLGGIEKAPFYAVAIYPGDVSTYGGLVTDEHARVLRGDSSVVEGLYAAGSTAASVCGHTYPGAGIAVGGSAVFGYLAVDHLSGQSNASSPSRA